MARPKPKQESSSEHEDDISEGYNSQDLDEPEPTKKPVKTQARAKSKAPPKKRRRKNEEESETEAFATDDEAVELGEGQHVAGHVIKAPTKGRVPPGQISQNTMDFLLKLTDPACNEREWFKLHDPVYRQAEKEFKDFVAEFADALTEVDEQVPPLPPKDLIHRIYRDVRFSNNKTPYKTGLSASFSRSGRKGIFAGYHISIKPGGKSLIAAGSWCPAKNEIATIRANLLRSPARLREVISNPEFVKYFGEPSPMPVKAKKAKKKPAKKGKDDDKAASSKKRKIEELSDEEEDAVDSEDEEDEFGTSSKRRSIFGMADELKNGPAGVPKDHKDIDLMKCRSFAVVHRFLDSEVTAPDFKNVLARVAGVMRPLVHCLNDMMTIQPSEDVEEDE